jgi:hypothetical protein
MGPGYSMLRKLGIKMAAEATTREALIRELKTCTESQASGDTMYMHSSLTIFSQELTVFLGYNNMQLMADLCDWFDCRDNWVYRTKSQGTDEISGVWVNLFGATTPELIQTTLPRDAIGGGLTARMIMIYEQRKGKTVEIPHLTEEEKSLGEVLQQDLERISILSGPFKVSKEFIEYWIDWYPMQDKNPPFDDSRFGGYIERRGMHVLKLSMITNVSRTDSMVIDVQDLQRAIGLLQSVEHKMSGVFTGVGKSPMSDVITRVMQYCATVGTCDFSMLMSKFYQDADKRTLESIVSTVESMGFVRITHEANRKIIKYTGKGANYGIY